MTDAECRAEMGDLIDRASSWNRHGCGPLQRREPTPYQRAVVRRIMDLFNWDEGEPIPSREEWEKACPPRDVEEDE